MATDSNELLARIWNDVMRNQNAAEAEAARADPVKHKLTRVFEGRMRSLAYHVPGTRKGRTVKWGWTTSRNVAGYFLGFREIETATHIKRDRWIASRRKQTLIDRAHRMAFKK